MGGRHRRRSLIFLVFQEFSGISVLGYVFRHFRVYIYHYYFNFNFCLVGALYPKIQA